MRDHSGFREECRKVEAKHEEFIALQRLSGLRPVGKVSRKRPQWPGMPPAWTIGTLEFTMLSGWKCGYGNRNGSPQVTAVTTPPLWSLTTVAHGPLASSLFWIVWQVWDSGHPSRGFTFPIKCWRRATQTSSSYPNSPMARNGKRKRNPSPTPSESAEIAPATAPLTGAAAKRARKETLYTGKADEEILGECKI